MFLITGAKGQLGKCLADIFAPSQIHLCDVADMDITDMSSIESFTKNKQFEAVINCAAYTSVDMAEDEKEKAYSINVRGPENLAKLCAARHIPLIHISTDYVFGGDCAEHILAESDKPAPKSVYGETKLQGELAVMKYAPSYVIIRTAWLYSVYGHNFLKTILRLASERSEVKVVADQIGTPTYAPDLADAIKTILYAPQRPGIKAVYNFSNEGVCTWYDFAHEIVRLKKLPCKVLPIKTSEYPVKAARPFFSVLDKSAIKKEFGLEIDHWSVGVKQCLKKLS